MKTTWFGLVLGALACGSSEALPDAPATHRASALASTSAAPPPIDSLPSSSARAAPPPARRRRVLAQGLRFDNPTAIVVDATTVYVSSAGRVFAVPKDGAGEPREVFARSTLAAAFVVDGRALYASAQLSDHVAPSMGGILRLDLATSEVTVLAPHKMPGALAMDDATIWYGALDQRAWRIPRGGGKPVGVPGVYGDIHAVALDGRRVYFASTVYGAKQRSVISAAPRKGGGPATVVLEQGLTDAMSLAVVGDDLFFNDNGRVGVHGLVSGETQLLSDRGSAISLAASPRGVFWCAVDISRAGAHVGMFDLKTREVRIVATDPAPVGVASDDDAVYWADAQTRELVALQLAEGPPTLP